MRLRNCRKCFNRRSNSTLLNLKRNDKSSQVPIKTETTERSSLITMILCHKGEGESIEKLIELIP